MPALNDQELPIPSYEGHSRLKYHLNSHSLGRDCIRQRAREFSSGIKHYCFLIKRLVMAILLAC